MKKWRQKLASVLVVSMMLGTVSAGAAYAEENPGKRAWVLEDGGWVYYRGQPDGDGNWQHVNRVVAIMERRVGKKVPYCFNEEGYMESDCVVSLSERQYNKLPEVIAEVGKGGGGSTEALILDEDIEGYEDSSDLHQIYVYPDGPIAIDEWVVLDSDGHLAEDPDADGCGWYYFGKDGLMAKNQEVESKVAEKNKTFRLDADGKMISSDFGAGKAADENPDLRTAKYYNHMGESIVDKWQYINGNWYSFDKDGYYHVASDSDAKFDENGCLKDGQKKKEPDIVSVKPADKKTEKTVAVGKSVDLDFTIELATPSNVEENWNFSLGRHDAWNKITFVDDDMPNLGVKSYQAKRGPAEAGENKRTKHVTITYTPLIPCETEVRLMIDGQNCAPYTVNATAGTLAAKGDAIKTMLSAKDGTAGQMDSALNPIIVKENIAMIFDGDVSDEDRTALKDVWKKQKSAVAELGGQYAMTNLVLENQAEVSDEALELLGDADVEQIELAGAALNAEEGQSVGLSIDEPAEKPELNLGDAKVEKRLDMDISFLLDEEETHQLDIPIILTMPLPTEFNGKKVAVYHTADGEEPEKIMSGTASGGAVSFVADAFSTYTFVVTGNGDSGEDGSDGDIDDDQNHNNGGNYGGGSHGDSGSDASSSSTVDGQWILDETGWWYRNADGSYPVNTWKQLPYNHVTDWYHFNGAGYMDFGWYTDGSGDTFYLNPESNGFKGAMLTGWRCIDQKWFYFNPVSDGRKGAMLKDVVVDGYYIQPDGVRAEIR